MADGSEEHLEKAKSRSKSRKRRYHTNPYLNFLREFRQLPENQNVSSKVIFVLAGQRWRSLSESEREPYVSQAQAARDEPGNFGVQPQQRRRRRGGALRRRMCSRCGHRHGSPKVDDDDGNTTHEDQSPTPSSRSRSRSPSGSKSDSKSGSVTTGEDFSDDTDTTF